MDPRRFDALLRLLAATSSRRGTVRLLVVSVFGGLSTFGAGDIDAHNALKKCKKKSGKQKKTCIKKAKQHNATHVGPTPPPSASVVCTPPCTVCEVCVSGSCQAASDDTVCNGNGRCLNRICNPRPTCAGAGADCE